MYGLKKNVVVKNANVIRRAVEQGCRIEQLEGRTLLSAAWATTSAIPNGSYYGLTINKMAASPTGNVYAVGNYIGSTNWDRGIALEMVAGSNTWTPILDFGISTASTQFEAVAADAAGDVYVAGRNGATAHYDIWERPAGQSSFVVIDDFAAGRFYSDLAIDGTGNVFAVGAEIYPTKSSPYTTHWIVRKQSNGQGPFTNVDDTGEGTTGNGIAIISGGANAGLYVTGRPNNVDIGGNIIVRKSTNGGTTWTDVQNFDFDPASPGGGHPTAITADAAGDVFVVGDGQKGIISGGTKGHPNYAYTQYWLVRESTDGGATWFTREAFAGGGALAAGTDPTTGTAYVIGSASEADASGTLRSHSLIHSYLGGTIATADDYLSPAGAYPSASGNNFAADASGHLYAGIVASGQGWIVRSPVPDPTPATATTSPLTATAAPTSTFSSVPIAPATNDSLLFSQPKDESLFAL